MNALNVLDALRALVDQVERSGAIDSNGHALRCLKAMSGARDLIRAAEASDDLDPRAKLNYLREVAKTAAHNLDRMGKRLLNKVERPGNLTGMNKSEAGTESKAIARSLWQALEISE